MATLLVIIPDQFADLVEKGELTPRYYNPGELFDEVHILATNDSQINPAKLQYTVGKAKLFLHYLPQPDFLKTCFFNLWLLRFWAKAGVKLAKEINPSLIRCHGAWLNSFLAFQIKRELGVPYVISLHINPDVNIRNNSTLLLRLYWTAMKKIEKTGLTNADKVLPVYTPIIPYLEKMGIRNYEVAYNVLNGEYLKHKTNFKLHKPVKLLSVGRLIKEKTPENIIKAIKDFNATLTIVGIGPEEDNLKRLVKSMRLQRKVKFIKSMPNKKLVSMLPRYDLFVIYSQYYEIGKALLEALLTGLPCVVSQRQKGDQVRELEGDHVMLIDGSTEGFKSAISFLVGHNKEREKLGLAAYKTAQAKWRPELTEKKYTKIYMSLMKNG